MEPFRQPIDEFHAHTKPADWLEGLVKAYVGDGIGTDFYREISTFVDPASRELVLDVCEDLGHSAFAVDRVRSAIAAVSSATTASRRLGRPHLRATSIGVRPAGMGKSSVYHASSSVAGAVVLASKSAPPSTSVRMLFR